MTATGPLFFQSLSFYLLKEQDVITTYVRKLCIYLGTIYNMIYMDIGVYWIYILCIIIPTLKYIHIVFKVKSTNLITISNSLIFGLSGYPLSKTMS